MTGIIDDGSDARSRLKACGEGSRIHEWVRIVRPEAISLGRGCAIDDFVLLAGGRGLSIGDRVHVASFCSIVGGGMAVLEDYSGLAAGCRIVTGSEGFMGEGMTNPCVPVEFRSVSISQVIIRRHALLFTNVIVLPGVEIAEGCVIAANTVVSKSTEPWGVYRTKDGHLTRVRDRPNDTIMRYERECIAKYGF